MFMIMILANLVLALHAATPGDDVQVIKASSEAVTVRVDAQVMTNGWRLTPELAPDVFLVDIHDGRPATVSFITDVDSVGFRVAVGDTCDFIIRWNGQDCWTRIVGRKFVPAANFDAAYQEAHRGTIAVSIPEVALRIADLVPEEEQERLIDMVESNTRNRGFTRFPEFDRFLLDLYRNRAEGETLEGLYPRIVSWFEARK